MHTSPDIHSCIATVVTSDLSCLSSSIVAVLLALLLVMWLLSPQHKLTVPVQKHHNQADLLHTHPTFKPA